MKRFLTAVTLAWCALSVQAQAPDIGITAQDTYAKVQQANAKVLFVDVRDPVEVMFVGFTDAVDINVPYLMVDRNAWDDKKGVYKLTQNAAFVAPSAALLRANGFPNARFVINGFQGAALKEGPQAGLRLQNGWQNVGLPWSTKMNPAKMYRTDPH